MTPQMLNPRSPAAVDWYAPVPQPTTDAVGPDQTDTALLGLLDVVLGYRCQFTGPVPIEAMTDGTDFGEPTDDDAARARAVELHDRLDQMDAWQAESEVTQ